MRDQKTHEIEELLGREDIWGPDRGSGGNEDENGEAYEQARWNRDIMLRKRQFEVAMAGDPLMLAWLGIQYLGQTVEIKAIKDEDPLAGLIAALDLSHKKHLAENGRMDGLRDASQRSGVSDARGI